MDKQMRGSRARGYWILALAIAVSLVLSIVSYQLLERQTQHDIDRISDLYAVRTESVVNSIFHKTDTLAAIVKLQNGDISEDTFEQIAQLVYEPDSGIRGIQYMPGAIVTYSYPLEGNEGVMGKNFFDIPDRRDDVMLAINTKSIALSGPYNLIQGGLGVVARNPIFLTDENGKEYFWGFSAIVLDLPDALSSVDLDNLSAEGYDYQLFSINENGERMVIDGNANMDTDNAICKTIQVPHHEWTLALTSIHPWANLVRSLIILLITLALGLLIWRLYCMMLREREATQAKDRFFSDISHDMRTPLNAIIGFSSLARSPHVTANQKDDYLDKIHSSGELLLSLVNDTLTLSKAGSGKIHLNLQPTDSDDIINAVIEPIREMADQKHIDLAIDLSAYEPRTILADRLSVEKIFLNLLNNAVRFTPEDGHVWATVTNIPGEDGHVDYLITIRDDGIGIGADFLPHIFEPFSQEQRKGYEGTGTGLGLSIVQQLIDLMDGSISVKSTEGVGTTFTVRLRFEIAQSAPAEPQTDDPDLASVDLTGKRILVCEDNDINREIAAHLLEQEKMTVDFEANGEEGLARFSKSPTGFYDCILMDIRMPVMDGYAATRAIRELDRPDARTVPIIAMTADAFAEDIQRCIDAGMDAHVSKPIEPAALYAALRRQIARRA